MSDDDIRALVERLEARRKTVHSRLAESVYEAFSEPDADCQEAATTITALAAERDEAQRKAEENWGHAIKMARRAALARAKEIVDTQAEDDGLWFVARTAPEAYLQQEVRRLHAAIEAEMDSETEQKP